MMLLLLLLLLMLRSESINVGQMLQIVNHLLQRHTDRQDRRRHRVQQLIGYRVGSPVAAATAAIAGAIGDNLNVRRRGRCWWATDVHRRNRWQRLKFHIHWREEGHKLNTQPMAVPVLPFGFELFFFCAQCSPLLSLGARAIAITITVLARRLFSYNAFTCFT